MVGQIMQHLRRHRRVMLAAVMAIGTLWSLAWPQRALDLWLTPDQQGWLWFRLGQYTRAADHFSDPRWRGIGLYAAGDFATAARYFSQYTDAAGLLARGNALAHSRNYLGAQAVYRELARRFPAHPAPAVNLPIVEALIEANRGLSERQVAETAEVVPEAADGPRSSEGDAREVQLRQQQLSAEELLADPALEAMWLRQVQRDPSEFLRNRFYRQLEAGSAEKTP
jgi:Ca-activated chloride channel family protein